MKKSEPKRREGEPFSSERIKQIEERTGMSFEDLRRASVEDIRDHLESRAGKTLPVKSDFPHVGRGNVMHGRMVQRKALNDAIDELL